MGKLNKKKMAELSDAAEVSDEKSNGGGADVNSSTENAGNVSNDEVSDCDPIVDENNESDEEEEEDEGEKITGDNDADDENEEAGSSKKAKKRKSNEKRKKQSEGGDSDEDVAEDEEEVPEKDDDADDDYVNGGSVAKKARKTNTKNNKKAPKKAVAKKQKKTKKASSEDEGLEADEADEKDDDEDEEEEEEYEVLDIVDKKVEKGVILYKIRWKGYTKADDTWEPEDTLSCPDIIERYNKKHGGKTGKAKNAASKTPVKAVAKPKTPKKAAGKSKGDTETEYEVEKVIDYSMEKGERLFRIRWKGFKAKDDTWEPESNLNCKELIEKFMEKMKGQEHVSVKELREEPKKPKRWANDRSASFNNAGRKSRRTGSKKRVYYGDSDE